MSTDLYWGIGWSLATVVISIGYARMILSNSDFINHDGAPVFLLPVLTGLAFLLVWPVATPVTLTMIWAYRVRARRKQQALEEAETNRILAENP